MTNLSTPAMTRSEKLALGLVLLVAALLRLYGIHRESPWADEVATLSIVRDASVLDVIQGSNERGHLMPGYFALAFLWSKVAGHAAAGLRLLSVAAGLTTIALLYHLVRLRFGHRAALAAAAFLTVSKTHVFYSQEIRSYSWASLLTLVSFVCLYHAVGSRHKRWWAGHYAANALLPWFHMFAMPALVAEGLWLLLAGSKLRRVAVWGCCNAMLLGLAVPWYMTLNPELTEATSSWIPEPTIEMALRILVLTTHPGPSYDTGLLPEWFAAFPWGPVANTVVWSFIVFGAIMLARNWNAGNAQNTKPLHFALIAWPLLALVMLAAASYLIRPMLAGRYVVFSIPPLCACAGIGLAAMGHTRLRQWAVACTATLFMFLHLAMERPLRPDWLSLTQTLYQEYRTGDRVFITDAAEIFVTIEFYLPAFRSALEELERSSDVIDAAVAYAQSGRTAWVVLEQNRETLDGLPQDVDMLFRSAGLRASSTTFEGHFRPTLFRIEKLPETSPPG